MPTQRGYLHHDNASAEGVVPVHMAYGSDVIAKVTENQAVEGVGPATMSTIPYKRRKQDNPSLPLCTREGCKGFATKKWPGLCAGHGRWSDSGDAG